MRGRRGGEGGNGFDGVYGGEGFSVVFGQRGRVTSVEVTDVETGQSTTPYVPDGSRWHRNLMGDYGEATPIGLALGKAVKTVRGRRRGLTRFVSGSRICALLKKISSCL